MEESTWLLIVFLAIRSCRDTVTVNAPELSGEGRGWLPKKTYGPAARKAWLGLTKYVDANADVTDVCEGTNKGFTYEYYMDRKRRTGDLHGQAATLWSAMALLR